MKKCPKCGNSKFFVTAHVCQDWKVDGNGNFLSTTNDCSQVTHFPDDEDMWTCTGCGYNSTGKEFNSSVVIEAEFVSEWDDTIVLTTKCSINTDTKEVFNIQTVDIAGVSNTTKEAVIIDGEEYPVFQYSDIVNEDDEYWYN